MGERMRRKREEGRQTDGWEAFVPLSATDGGSVTGKETTEWGEDEEWRIYAAALSADFSLWETAAPTT